VLTTLIFAYVYVFFKKILFCLVGFSLVATAVFILSPFISFSLSVNAQLGQCDRFWMCQKVTNFTSTFVSLDAMEWLKVTQAMSTNPKTMLLVGKCLNLSF
jgi:hypothetical protein